MASKSLKIKPEMKLLIHLYLSSSCSVGLKIKSDAIGWQTICSVNQKIYKRTDTLWEGRYKASLIEAEPYLLAWNWYIELNPFRAMMVKYPADFRWSSYCVNAGFRKRCNLVMHDIYKNLANNDFERFSVY